MHNVIASIATVGRYSLKVFNSLVHGGPYIAIHIGARRVAWLSFRTGTHESYSGVSTSDLRGIREVEEWFADPENFNMAATAWNNFGNNVNVALKEIT